MKYFSCNNSMINLIYPPVVHWEVTPKCNHNCIHCYNYWRKDYNVINSFKSYNEEYYVSLAKEIIKNKPELIVITGGEPLLVFNEIKSTIDLFLKSNINVSINTNGTLITDEIADFFKERGISLFVSFPCANQKICDEITNCKNSFIKIVRGLDRIKDKKIDFSINMVVSKRNLEYIEETVKFLKERYNISRICITRVGKPSNSSEEFDKDLLNIEDFKNMQVDLIRISKKYNVFIDSACPYTPCSLYTQETFDYFAYKRACTAGKTSYAIDVNGNVRACPRETFDYGNIKNDNFNDIWKKMSMWRDGSILPEECKNCKELPKCLGGCRLDDFPFSGKYNSLDAISNKNNIPIRFKPKDKVNNIYDKDCIFNTNCNIKYVQEEQCVRVLYKKSYCYVTKQFESFLKGRSNFSMYEFMEEFQMDYIDACNVINILIINNIIYILNKKEVFANE